MTIIQFQRAVVDNFAVIYGLGDDGKVYTYSYAKGTWKPYKKVSK